MLRILRLLITGDWHLHKWKVIEERRVEGKYGSAWTRRYCQCEHCGSIKVFDI